MDALETVKAELAIMREEKICIEASLRAVQCALEENKRALSEYKALKKLTDDLLDVVIEAGGGKVNENNSQINLDEETMKGLTEEAVRDFTEALNKAQARQSCPADGRDIGGSGNGGGDDGTDGRPE